jgi:hypothetical protein
MEPHRLRREAIRRWEGGGGMIKVDGSGLIKVHDCLYLGRPAVLLAPSGVVFGLPNASCGQYVTDYVKQLRDLAESIEKEAEEMAKKEQAQ